MTREQLQDIIDTTGNAEIRSMAQAELQKLELAEKAAQGDELSKTLLVLKDAIDKFKSQQPQSGGSVSKQEVEKLIKELLPQVSHGKITYDDLDAELRAKLAGQVKIQLSLTTPTSSGIASSKTLLQQFERPLFQKLLSDWKARNNAYLYGGAGTGKSYTAEMIANFLGYEYIELNCNQFTSPLDIIGGQTIEGYQWGKLEMAWSNEDKDGNKFNGAVLCLDELPKLDPNTAGLLNAALAKVKSADPNNPPFIYNGRSQKVFLKNMFVIATGNTRLNEVSTEYEANFKQDLSLQDRFAGSTYEITVDYRNEFEVIMRGFAFIWIYMTKVREIINANKMSSQAFVSIRIMQSMRDTYIVYRDIESQKINKDASLTSPKTLKQSLDSFLNLFKPNQIELIKQESNYNEFISIVEEKNKLPLSSLDTEKELDTARTMIEKNEQTESQKTA